MIKRLLALLFILLFIPGCKSTTKPTQNRDRTHPASTQPISAPGWALYSEGLFKKHTALREKSLKERRLILVQAIELFKKALEENSSTGPILFEISDCYYYLFNFQQSTEYARKSIKADPKDIRPYQRLYSIQMKLRQYKDAATTLEDYIKQEPTAINVQYILAEHYANKIKNNSKAIEAFKKVIKLADKVQSGGLYLEKTHYYLGYIYYKNNNIERSINHYEAVIKVNHENHEARYMLAYLYMSNYNLEKAGLHAQIYANKYPDNIFINSILGRVLYLRERPAAIHYLRKSMGASSVEEILSKGLYYEMTGNHEKANHFLQMAIKLNPRFVSPHIALAKIELKGNDTEKSFNQLITAGAMAYNSGLHHQALKMLLNAEKIKHDVPELFYYLGRTYEDLKNYSTAIHYFKKAQALKNNLDIQLHIGYLYAMKKDYTHAYQYFDAAEEMDKNNSRPHFFRGLVFLWEKKYTNSEKSLNRAIELKKDSESYYFYLAVALEKQQRLNDAIAALEEAIRQDPNSDRACNYLGYLFADNNIQIERAYKLIQKALSIEPDNGAYLDSLGWVYFRQGKFQDALNMLLQAEERLRESENIDPVVYDHIGDTYLKLGNRKMALEFWEKSIKIEKSEKIQKKISEHKSK